MSVFPACSAAATASTHAQAGTEHGDAGKLVRHGEGGGQCLAAPHGQAGDGTVRLIGVHAVVAFRVGQTRIRDRQECGSLLPVFFRLDGADQLLPAGFIVVARGVEFPRLADGHEAGGHAKHDENKAKQGKNPGRAMAGGKQGPRAASNNADNHGDNAPGNGRLASGPVPSAHHQVFARHGPFAIQLTQLVLHFNQLQIAGNLPGLLLDFFEHLGEDRRGGALDGKARVAVVTGEKPRFFVNLQRGAAVA